MNILLVDDDDYIIQALRCKIHWEELGIRAVYSAHNIRQAIELLKKLPIQLMICDIEMPQGSGLELLAWIRKQGYEIQAIFLTSYADFQYAQKAIELQSLKFYLKPVDYAQLEQGIREAALKAGERTKQMQYQVESGYWKNNQESILRNFFRSLLDREVFSAENGLEQAVCQAGLPYQPETQFLPVWLQLYDEEKRLEGWENVRLSLAVEELVQECFKGLECEELRVVMMDRLAFVILLRGKEFSFVNLQSAADRLSQRLQEAFSVQVFEGIGVNTALTGLKAAVEQLKRIGADNVTRESLVLSVLEYENRRIPYHLPAMTAWETLLKEDRMEEFLTRVEAYLEGLKAERQLNQEILKLFRMDVLQLMYARLKQTQVESFRLLVNDMGERLYQQSIQSVPDMMTYAKYLTRSVMEYAGLAERSQSVIRILTDYIDTHYQKEITRNDLAQLVYLNQDYLSRLFKKETGMSISAYLLKKRLDIARELLENTNMPANVISTQVGYENYPYFSRMFHENTGYSPMEYRKQHKKGKEKEKR